VPVLRLAAAVLPTLVAGCLWIGKDDGQNQTAHREVDGDTPAIDADGDGFSPPEDCDDSDPNVHPEAVETCDDVDSNCSGDESDATDMVSWFVDSDSDGAGDAYASPVSACSPPEGHVPTANDCDDNDSDVHPGADELCATVGVDDDCDGDVDEDDAADAPRWYVDGDGDGYGDETSGEASCIELSGRIARGGDCDDTDAAVHPDALETCDGVDTNCSGDETDASDAVDWFLDDDGDYYGDPETGVRDCDPPDEWYVRDASDCDDTDPEVSPFEDETCNDGIDNDCDGGAPDCRYSGSLTETSYYFSGAGHIDLYPTLVGSLDIDGLADSVVGDPDEDAVFVHLTSGGLHPFGPSTADLALLEEDTSDRLWLTPATGSDLDHDGVNDLIVGGPTANGSTKGGAYVVVGPLTAGSAEVSLSSPGVHRVYGDSSNDTFGTSLAGGMDVNNDGFTDLIVGAPGNDDGALEGGAVYILDTAPAGRDASTESEAVLLGENEDDEAGERVALGDLNGDGLGDVLVAAPGESNDYGAVYIVLGDSALTGTIDLRSWDGKISGSSASDAFGAALSAGGDVNGDGYDDVLVGAPDGGGSEEGMVYLFHGPSTAARSLSAAAATGYGGAAEDDFGRGAAIVGDTDGDGHAELAVGSPGFETASSYGNIGRIQLFYGPVSGGMTAAAAYHGTFAITRTGGFISDGADATGDGYADFWATSEISYVYDTPYGMNAYFFQGLGM